MFLVGYGCAIFNNCAHAKIWEYFSNQGGFHLDSTFLTPQHQPTPGVTNEDRSLTSDEPTIEQEDTIRKIAIHLIPETDAQSECFWLGLFHKGSLTPPELLEHQSISELFNEAASKGLKEQGPVMLSDSNGNKTRFVYLLPEPPTDFDSKSKWVQQLVETVKSWAPPKVGIYLSKELLGKELTHELLIDILQNLIKTGKSTDYYLIPGAHGLNTILNSALEIKSKLSDDKLWVYVFH